MHRDQILAAARSLLGRKPYDEITVQEIAADAEFSVGYIYKIFESKEDIYVTLVRDQGDELLRIVDRELGARGGFEARLLNMVHGVFDWLDSNPFTATQMNETHCLTHALPRLAAVHAEREERLQEKTYAFFREGLQAGVIQGDLDIMVRTLRALIWGFIGDDLLHGVKSRKLTEYAPVAVQVLMRAFAPEGGSR
jgi:AcrR family transcriptional regulator